MDVQQKQKQNIFYQKPGQLYSVATKAGLIDEY